ncbi:MAG: response regulator [Flavobacterium sp.]
MEPQYTFFIIDDDFFYANILQQYLENLNFTAITYFDNGQDCLKNLDKKPDIIFLDQNMDGLSGFDILKQIKNTHPEIYVVMVSGEVSSEIITEAYDLGAYDFIKKDITNYQNIKDVIEKITQIKADLLNK